MPNLGRLRGRGLNEALAGGPAAVRSSRTVKRRGHQKTGFDVLMIRSPTIGSIWMTCALLRAQTCH